MVLQVTGTDQTLAVAIISSLTAIVLAFMNQRTRADLKRHGDKIEVVRDQVQNSHGTNLREDIDMVLRAQLNTDGMIRMVIEGQRSHSTDLSQLRLDMAQERKERLAGDDRLDDLIDRINN